MKNIITMIAAVAVASLISTSANAAEKTLKGEALCAKCELKETAKCQNAVRVEEDGKKVVYYLEDNDATKGFHKKVCTSVIKVVTTGKVSEKDGKKWFAVTKIDEAK